MAHTAAGCRCAQGLQCGYRRGRTPLRPVLAAGDSHVWAAGAGGAVPLHQGPVTLNRLGRTGEITSLLGHLDGHGSVMLLIAGEIDVRAHVATQVSRGRSEGVICATLAEGAKVALGELTALGFDARMVSVIPPMGDEDLSEQWGPYPFRGSLEDRVRWNKLLNKELISRVPVVSPYDEFTTATGSLEVSYSDGVIHLRKEFGPRAFGPIIAKLSQDRTR